MPQSLGVPPGQPKGPVFALWATPGMLGSPTFTSAGINPVGGEVNESGHARKGVVTVIVIMNADA